MIAKCQGWKEKIPSQSRYVRELITVRPPEEAAEQNALISVLHENEGQNSLPERSGMELSDTKN
jgi:hypothetical protein